VPLHILLGTEADPGVPRESDPAHAGQMRDQTCPTIPTKPPALAANATNAQKAEYELKLKIYPVNVAAWREEAAEWDRKMKKHEDWVKRADELCSALELILSTDLCILVKGKSVSDSWQFLIRKFAKDTPTSKFAEFQDILHFKFSGGNPSNKLTHYNSLIDTFEEGGLGGASLVLPDFFKCMFLLNTTPPKWSQGVNFALQMAPSTGALDFNDCFDCIKIA
jgi:hypothetical protein